jgi:hypothetical protein
MDPTGVRLAATASGEGPAVESPNLAAINANRVAVGTCLVRAGLTVTAERFEPALERLVLAAVRLARTAARLVLDRAGRQRTGARIVLSVARIPLPVERLGSAAASLVLTSSRLHPTGVRSPPDLSGGAAEGVGLGAPGAGEDAGGPRRGFYFTSSTGQRATMATR